MHMLHNVVKSFLKETEYLYLCLNYGCAANGVH